MFSSMEAEKITMRAGSREKTVGSLIGSAILDAEASFENSIFFLVTKLGHLDFTKSDLVLTKESCKVLFSTLVASRD